MQVLIRVHAASLNPAGYKFIKYFPSITIKKPAIPDLDISGTITTIGSDVKDWQPGDKIFGSIPAIDMMRHGHGALTEYALLHADNMSDMVQLLYVC